MSSHQNEQMAVDDGDNDDNMIAAEIPVKAIKPSFHRNGGSRRQSFVPNDISYHPGCQICFFAPPRQRQRWGDTQILPRVNWGDLFFDLFYVAAAYNTSNILVFAPENKGILYFLGTFLPVMGLWTDKLYYDARYTVADDVFHRVFELAVLIVLATAVVFIRPLDTLSHPSDNVDMFGFAIAVFFGRLLTVARYVEVYWLGEGQPVIRIATVNEIKGFVISLVGYGAAAIVAGIDYYGASHEEHSESNHVPIILVVAAYVIGHVYSSIRILFFFPPGGRHKEISIPLNIDFVIHRNGEWVMLMLGESVLSLLTVGVEHEGRDYLLTFYAAMLSVILLQYLHFRSQPTHADQHAMRRHKNAGIGFAFFSEVYSASLIVLGSAYTLLVAAFDQPSIGSGNGHRRGLEADVVLGNYNKERSLSSEALPTLSDHDVQQRVANMFCGSLVVILICSDAKFLLHLGLKNINNKCQFGSSKKANVKGITLICLKIALLVFIGTVSRYETRPERLALIGLGCICAKLILRCIGGHYFSSHDEHHDHDHHHDQHDHHHMTSPPPPDETHESKGHQQDNINPSKENNDKEADSNDDDDSDEMFECGNSAADNEDDDPEEGKWPNVNHARAKPAKVVD